jgi:hypothetical protein
MWVLGQDKARQSSRQIGKQGDVWLAQRTSFTEVQTDLGNLR